MMNIMPIPKNIYSMIHPMNPISTKILNNKCSLFPDFCKFPNKFFKQGRFEKFPWQSPSPLICPSFVHRCGSPQSEFAPHTWPSGPNFMAIENVEVEISHMNHSPHSRHELTKSRFRPFSLLLDDVLQTSSSPVSHERYR